MLIAWAKIFNCIMYRLTQVDLEKGHKTVVVVVVVYVIFRKKY